MYRCINVSVSVCYNSFLGVFVCVANADRSNNEMLWPVGVIFLCKM